MWPVPIEGDFISKLLWIIWKKCFLFLYGSWHTRGRKYAANVQKKKKKKSSHRQAGKQSSSTEIYCSTLWALELPLNKSFIIVLLWGDLISADGLGEGILQNRTLLVLWRRSGRTHLTTWPLVGRVGVTALVAEYRSLVLSNGGADLWAPTAGSLLFHSESGWDIFIHSVLITSIHTQLKISQSDAWP